MSKHAFALLVILLLLVPIASFKIEKAHATTIVVPDDYPTIQEAINNANEEDTVLVRNGTYHEQLTVNKTITLEGESRDTTILDGVGSPQIAVEVDADNVKITGFTIQHCSTGIWVNEYSNCTISGNTVTNNQRGVVLSSSANTTISANYITASTQGSGISLRSSDNNWVYENTITDNAMDGISVSSSSNNSITGNCITENIQGAGVYIGSNPPETSSYNSVTGNTISDNEWGIWFVANYSIISANTITDCSWAGILVDHHSICNSIAGNDLRNNYHGIWLYSPADGNTIFHNNFVNNADQVYSSQPVNVWDEGYPSGGNYWSDFNSPDVFSGPYQNETGSDGIGDTPYVIDANNTDSYPLIYPYGYIPSPDFNNDGLIDIFDLVRLALAYGSTPGMLNWDPYVDLNQDGLIDIFDLVTVAVNFGKEWTPP